MAKFIQIAGGAGDFFALDADGIVWRYRYELKTGDTITRTGGWVQCELERFPLEP